MACLPGQRYPNNNAGRLSATCKRSGNRRSAPAGSAPAAPLVAVKLNAPPPKPPFTDFRYEKPGKIRKITVKDLPAPFATSSAGNGPQVVARPEGAWPQVPAGFKVEQYAAVSIIRGSFAPLPMATFLWPRPRPATSEYFAGSPARASPSRCRCSPAD